MALELFPSARLFLGPSDALYGYDRIWIIIYEGYRDFIGRNGEDKEDLRLLSAALAEKKKWRARRLLINTLTDSDPTRMPDWWQNRYDRAKTPRANAALNGDTPLVWTIDFDQDRVFYDRDGFHLVRELNTSDGRPLRLRQFKPYVPLKLSSRPTTASSAICSREVAPQDVIPKQLFDLVYRITSDYELNWREAGYNVEDYGLTQLAMGVLSCFTLNFQSLTIHPNQLHWNMRNWREGVCPEKLLHWRAWPSPQIVPAIYLNGVYFIFTERISDAMSLVNDHYVDVAFDPSKHIADTDFFSDTTWCCNPTCNITYIVTSITHIQVYRKAQRSVKCTPVEPFFDGQNPPSEIAVRWMLNAIHGDAYPLTTRIHKLPLELQEMILDYASGGEIDRAYYAGILGLGIPFEWKSGGMPLKRLKLSKNRKISETFHEQQIHFWNNFVGITYQPDDGRAPSRSPEPDFSEYEEDELL